MYYQQMFTSWKSLCIGVGWEVDAESEFPSVVFVEISFSWLFLLYIWIWIWLFAHLCSCCGVHVYCELGLSHPWAWAYQSLGYVSQGDLNRHKDKTINMNTQPMCVCLSDSIHAAYTCFLACHSKYKRAIFRSCCFMSTWLSCSKLMLA